MAVISDINRYEGPTSRMVGFSSDKVILDNRVLDGDRIQINVKTIDLPGHRQELLAGEYAGFNYKMSPRLYTNSYPVKTELHDVTSDNPVFGRSYWSDPIDENENYVSTNQYVYDSGKALNYLYKLDKDGNITGSVTNTNLCRFFVDADENYLYTLEYNPTNYYFELYKINRKTLKYVGNPAQGTAQYRMDGQILSRDNNRLIYIHNNIGAPKVYDKSELTDSPKLKDMSKKRTETKDLTKGGYSEHGVTNYTPAMKNGWHFKPVVHSTYKDQAFSFEALLIDMDDLTYDTKAKDEITVNWAEGIDEKFKNLTYRDTSTVYYNHFKCFKVSDNIFVIICLIDYRTRTSLGSELKSYYYVCQTDDSNPETIKVLNAKDFDYNYLDGMVRYDRDKFVLVQEDVAAHVYKFNKETNTLDLSWEIKTPNIVSCCYHNGVFWWLNGSTSELNYEVEANTLTIKDKFLKTEVPTTKDGETVNNTYVLSIYNSEKQRVVKEVELTLYGPGVFDDDTKVKRLSTSAEDDISVTVKVSKPGFTTINVSVIN